MTLAEWSQKLKRRSPRPDLPPLLLMTDQRLADPLAAVARLPAGCGVILRDGAERGPGYARAVARLCRQRRLVLLVSNDERLALKLGADGIHLPEHRVARRWQRRRTTWIITAAAHGLPAMLAARHRGVDAVLLSPIFPTRSHQGARPLGPRRLACWMRIAGLPVYALGGVTWATARRIRRLPLAGIAAIDGLTPED